VTGGGGVSAGGIGADQFCEGAGGIEVGVVVVCAVGDMLNEQQHRAIGDVFREALWGKVTD
jgi:hypothetical protein